LTRNSLASEETGELVGIDRLDDVGVESRLLRAPSVLGIAVAGERYQKRARTRQLAEPARHLVAVDSGQADVDERHRRPFGARDLETLRAVGGGFDVVAVELEQHAEGVSSVGVVFDEEYEGHRLRLHRTMRAK
jgi:hypothetical protein